MEFFASITDIVRCFSFLWVLSGPLIFVTYYRRKTLYFILEGNKADQTIIISLKICVLQSVSDFVDVAKGLIMLTKL